MTLNDIFTQLTHGELSQLALGGEAGVIPEAQYPALLAHINLGLLALYKRFPIKEGRLTVRLQPGRQTYPLSMLYARSNRRSREPVRFIEDTPEDAFSDDILKVERVHVASGWELGLNDAGDPLAITTPTATTLRVPLPLAVQSPDLPDALKTETLEVVYRASHPKIEQGLGMFDPARIEIELPYTHLEPLLLFIAARVHTPVGMTGEFHTGNNYMTKYEMACQQLEQVNLRVDQGGQYSRLRRGGWV